MRANLISLVLVMMAGLACRSGGSVPEAGSALLRVSTAVESPLPDELRVWAYHDGGRLWDGARVPEAGSLKGSSAADLGTILMAPGAIQGALRVHVRALKDGGRLADGVLTIPSLAGGKRTYDLRLTADVPVDDDQDDVPDAIDDCLGQANPSQGGCASSGADGGGDRGGSGGGGGGAAGTTSGVGGSPDASATGSDSWPSSGGARDAANGGAVDSSLDASPVADAKPAIDRAPVDVATVPDVVVSVDRTPTLPDSAVKDAAEQDACGSNCKKSQGESCKSNDECASSYCADSVCCSNACAGLCRSCNQPSAVGTCQGYTVGSDPEGECSGGAKCNGVGACGTAPPPPKPNGEPCTFGNECSSQFCRDGVCCNEFCSLPCQSCRTGTCTAVTSADDAPECAGAVTCNAKGKCVGR